MQGVSVTLSPHPEHWYVAQTSATLKPVRGSTVEGSVTVAGATSTVIGTEVEAKHTGPDFHAVASVTSGPETQGSLTYHQSVTPQLTLGGGITADLVRVLPLPDPRALTWRAFGTYHDMKGSSWALAGFDSSRSALSVRAWHQVRE
jgi:hypothetical protein